ncbi:ABC transporter substrate-binding protein [Thalassomonas viridans]|uniref:ABC transporter substrate-binding protein n=1 Tax=Thalassomonas viridans TaxID=137584 RepID=A0AAE9Z131_9GAMM|nr:ABC transporter substrate-binding protein [Thalassomonas viridans]WDE04084.1 ABC transporter substrate-binding protein [Thalassomonas viridans]
MAFSLDIPPYIFEQYNKGIEIDIIAAALSHKGHTLRPLYFPLGRIPIAFQNNLVDAAMSDVGTDLMSYGGFYAEPAVVYDNVFITLKKRNLVINSPADLDNLTIISFQGAEKRYPQWLSKPFEEKRFYGISDQLTQVKLLNLERYDVVLSDRYIFKYFAKQLKYEDNIQVSRVDEHQFAEIEPQDYRPVFKSEKIRDDFNFGLKKLKESGKFQAIYDHYIE